MYYICVHCFLIDPRNISASIYIVDTTFEKMIHIKNYVLTQLNIGSILSNYFKMKYTDLIFLKVLRIFTNASMNVMSPS
jgi:hypothetical protein